MALRVYECQTLLSGGLGRLEVVEQRDPHRVPHEPGGEVANGLERVADHVALNRNAKLTAWRRPTPSRWRKSSLFASGAASSSRARRSTGGSRRPTTSATTAC